MKSFLDIWTTFPPSHKISIQMTVAKCQIFPINKLVASAIQPFPKVSVTALKIPHITVKEKI
jgi:hypothetical protein